MDNIATMTMGQILSKLRTIGLHFAGETSAGITFEDTEASMGQSYRDYKTFRNWESVLEYANLIY